MSRSKVKYFKHYNDMASDECIAELKMEMGAEGYGVFMMLLELLSSREGYCLKRDYVKIAFMIQCPGKENSIKQVVEDYGLFEGAAETFHSLYMTEAMEEYDEKCRINSENRMKGIEKKKARQQDNEDGDNVTTVVRPLKDGSPIEKKRREENKIEKKRQEERVEGEKIFTKAFFKECVLSVKLHPGLVLMEYFFFLQQNQDLTFKSRDDFSNNLLKAKKNFENIDLKLEVLCQDGLGIGKNKYSHIYDAFMEDEKSITGGKPQNVLESFISFDQTLQESKPSKEYKRVYEILEGIFDSNKLD